MWPWQRPEYLIANNGDILLKDGEPVIVSYSRYMPEHFTPELLIAVAVIIFGVASIWAIEKVAEN
jgi:hypothetical protein